MNFIRGIIEIPVFIAVIVLAVINDGFTKFTLKPLDIDVTVSLSVLILGLFIIGYFIGRLDGYVAAAPLRAQLREHKKNNKVLNKEHDKLSKEHEKLNADFSSLKQNFTLLKGQNDEQIKAQRWAKFLNFFKFKKD